MFRNFFKRLLSSWSGSEFSELDLNIGLYKYGIDSIVATNMRLKIQSSIGATFEVRVQFLGQQELVKQN